MPDSSIKIAIIVNVYEKARELREIGGGLNVGPHTRDVLRKLGADSSITGSDMFPILHLKGSNGDLLCTQQARRGAPEREHQRVRRSVLHRALLANVPEANIHLNKTLESITVGNEAGGIVLTFDDDTEIEADLVIGADGVRSRVRQYAFPEASIKFIGVTAYRALMPLSQVARISSFDHRKTTLWYMPQKGYMYSPIEDNQAGDNKCELVLRELSDPLQLTEAQNIDTPVPNGVEVDNIIVEDTFREFEPAAKALLQCVPKGAWIKYASFAGPPLPSSVKGNKIVLFGDSANPMSGAFGSGATFGLQDGWTFGKSLARLLETGATDPVSKALMAFDSIRGPFYQELYKTLGDMKARGQQIAHNEGWEASWIDFANRHYGEDLNWIYYHDIEQSLNNYFKQDRIST
ncbi:hypothetical protein COCC4DRAFT_22044 [Bipolaris maydis ATCC 48331]|uniref:FAD-binding domain-containing protein n=2 Tax=Cochliobolus heterostrophus TaxID=5016 RepID=M2UZI7_COCH5|nr:uncharacterized protein COCC4DRAFT_22044 [Bipolaris maydis ATCC 48331]EMD93213.1 hypothetical protein COCHEDRAFT_1028424 [Bipolaris maydis C5]ENI07340.1 hypothetical protein COCC4DRAFT_22044 [Bipolaris maydis ATCC 48331]KAJ5027555.1 hypothetical protein J3E73DRAFT_185403 [Bipolaris maydis]